MRLVHPGRPGEGTQRRERKIKAGGQGVNHWDTLLGSELAVGVFTWLRKQTSALSWVSEEVTVHTAVGKNAKKIYKG